MRIKSEIIPVPFSAGKIKRGKPFSELSISIYSLKVGQKLIANLEKGYSYENLKHYISRIFSSINMREGFMRRKYTQKKIIENKVYNCKLCGRKIKPKIIGYEILRLK